MEWIPLLFEYLKNMSGIITVFTPLVYLIYSFSERRVLTNKIDNFFTLFTIFLLNIYIYAIFTFLFLFYLYYENDRDLFNHSASSVILLSIVIFLLIISLILEMIYQSKLRMTFTLISASNVTGLLIKQKTTDSFRIIKYQVLNDKEKEKDINKFHRKIYREIGLSLVEEYIEENFFISNVIYRLKSIKIFDGKFSLFAIGFLRWLLVLFIGISGFIILSFFNLNYIWTFMILFLIAVISMIKNIVCMKAVISNNEKLIKREYEKYSKK
ncbi:hypothetical protein [Staphylococcus cohnii]|uniref:hypothetical protein n=1 Tax=Staphylococcus cohnii TaxID=29382 RepID=UPI0025504E75|nr:hypothetical protein [Staphylococcus cohnii]WIL69773.1 hypothetical protein QMK35_00650 [Staphylococcus cohnii]